MTLRSTNSCFLHHILLLLRFRFYFRILLLLRFHILLLLLLRFHILLQRVVVAPPGPGWPCYHTSLLHNIRHQREQMQTYSFLAICVSSVLTVGVTVVTVTQVWEGVTWGTVGVQDWSSM